MNSTQISEDNYKLFAGSLLKGDRKTCHDIVVKLLDADIEIKEMYVHLFQRALLK